MKVLFVSSGNSGDVSTIIKSQGESLKKFNVTVEYFAIKGKGIKGYIKNIYLLRKHLKNNKYNCVHAHYLFSALVATLAGANPLFVSLMGSDSSKKGFYKLLIKFFVSKIWSATIVKSEKMQKEIGDNSILILPNGVDFNRFQPINRMLALEKINWDAEKKHILFAANSNRSEKNFPLAQAAFKSINKPNIELHTLENINFELIPYYLNAADVVLLTSFREGSPNVIKEAMACNRPVVVTNVGDVKKVLGNVKNTFIVESNKEGVSNALKYILAQEYSSTLGRETIQWLNQDLIAKKLITIYNSIQK